MTQEPGTDWPELLGYMGRFSLDLAELEPEAFPMTYPRVGATDDDIREAEERIGFALDPLHKRLLQTGNGWPGTLITTGDLLGTGELGASSAWSTAVARLDDSYRRGAATAPPREEIYPIAAFWDTPEVAAIWREGPVTDGGHPVLWFDVAVTRSWPNLWEWWTDMLRSRREIVAVARRSHESEQKK